MSCQSKFISCHNLSPHQIISIFYLRRVDGNSLPLISVFGRVTLMEGRQAIQRGSCERQGLMFCGSVRQSSLGEIGRGTERGQGTKLGQCRERRRKGGRRASGERKCTKVATVFYPAIIHSGTIKIISKHRLPSLSWLVVKTGN